MKQGKFFMLTTLLGASALVLAACGGTENENGSSGASADGGETLSGQVAIDGSSTVFPIMEAVSEEYTAEQPDVQAPVGVSGTGGGFKRFVEGETDLSNASRHIKEEEASFAEENGVEYIELELAMDGISVLVHPDNDWVDHFTVEELKMMWTDESVELWSDVRPEWPDEEIEFFAPGTDSGTFDYWGEVILEEDDVRRDAQLSEDDNVLVNGIAGSPNATGFFGYAYYIENQDSLKVVPIDNGDGPVEPTEETINSGDYAPLSRPIFTYVSVESLSRPEVYDYVTFMNEVVGDLALEVGYINLPQENYDNNTQLIEEAAGN